MNIFQEIKTFVSAVKAAELYGIKINRNKMACCPFHDDRHPSMKIDQNYYCFACGAKGDVIDFTARLFGISQFDAARKLIGDFRLPIKLEKTDEHSKEVQKQEAFNGTKSVSFFGKKQGYNLEKSCRKGFDRLSVVDPVLETVLRV